MLKINKINVPFSTKMKIFQEKGHLKGLGYSNFTVTANKKGDAALLTYKNPEHDELYIANIFKADGSETVTYYRTSERGYRKPYVKIIETWDKIKKDLIFKKSTQIRYNGDSKVPESISTMYSDANTCDGVEIVTTFPFQKYAQKFQRPTE